MSNSKSFHVPNVTTHTMTSRYVQQTYEIRVMQPWMKVNAAERFPVLYLSDANLSFDFARGIAHCLQATGQVRRFILVGIGYPGDNPFMGDLLRCRDYTPKGRPEYPDLPRESPIAGVPGILAGQPVWGGAAEFLAFVQEQLVPCIDATYPTVNGDRGYFGHSLGGSLGLEALLTQPGLFTRFGISSPGISLGGDEYYLREAERLTTARGSIAARLVMSVAAGEEFEPDFAGSRLVSNFYRLAQLLQRPGIPGLDFRWRVFQGETHVSVWPVAFSHQVRMLYGPAPQGEKLP